MDYNSLAEFPPISWKSQDGSKLTLRTLGTDEVDYLDADNHMLQVFFTIPSADELRDYLIGLNSDESIRRLKGATRPVNSLQTRLDVLEAIQYIDWIIVFEEDTPLRLLEELRPDILVKGGDYAMESVLGREFVGETRICSFMEGVSSTATIKKIQESV